MINNIDDAIEILHSNTWWVKYAQGFIVIDTVIDDNHLASLIIIRNFVIAYLKVTSVRYLIII